MLTAFRGNNVGNLHDESESMKEPGGEIPAEDVVVENGSRAARKAGELKNEPWFRWTALFVTLAIWLTVLLWMQTRHDAAFQTTEKQTAEKATVVPTLLEHLTSERTVCEGSRIGFRKHPRQHGIRASEATKASWKCGENQRGTHPADHQSRREDRRGVSEVIDRTLSRREPPETRRSSLPDCAVRARSDRRVESSRRLRRSPRCG